MQIGDYEFKYHDDGLSVVFSPSYRIYDEWDRMDSSKLHQMAIQALSNIKQPTTKENNMTNTFITIDGATYKTSGGTMKIGPGNFCEIEVEACMCPGNKVNLTPQIKDVIFNPPATIVFWSDNMKTVVKALDGDEYDPEKGIAMAISKKMLGNKYDYYHTFQRYLKKWDKQQAEETINT